MSTQNSAASNAIRTSRRWAVRWAAKRAAQAAVATLGWKVIVALLLVAILFLIPIVAVVAVSLLSVITTPSTPETGQIADVKYAEIINEAVQRASEKYGVDLSPSLVAAMIRQESNFNPKAQSHMGAQGLMQIMPFNLKGADPYDPRENIFRGTEIIASHLKAYNGDVQLALSAYNAGSGAVAKDLRKGGDGIPDNGETPEYVANVLKYQKQYQSMVKNGEVAAALGGGSLGLPAKSKISCGFTCYEDHGGIDFSGKGGRAVYAAEDGRVVRVENLKGRSYGTLVVIDHGGVETAYAHMYPKQIQVDPGDSVKRGQRIGTMGDNGRAKGVHLHFEVRKNGQRINPQTYLEAKK